MIRVKSQVQLIQEFLQEFPDLDLKTLPVYIDGSHTLSCEDGTCFGRATYEGYAVTPVAHSMTCRPKLLKFVKSSIFTHSTIIEVGEIL